MLWFWISKAANDPAGYVASTSSTAIDPSANTPAVNSMVA
jgi:hypothetical protein